MSDTREIHAEIAAVFGDWLSAADAEQALDDSEVAYLQQHWVALGSVDEIWRLMDQDWDQTGAGYTPAEAKALGEFYSSPIWLLNGIFTELDEESRGHRNAIASYIAKLNPTHLADYGGGFGAFSRRLGQSLPDCRIEVIEPYPTKLAQILGQNSGIAYQSKLPEKPDIITAQDVLEHVIDPLKLMGELLAALEPGALVITANCFKPVIKCHYPGAYHLHFTFRHIAARLGCEFVETVPGAGHAEVFRKTDAAPDWAAARRLERLSRAVHPLMKGAQSAKRIFSSAR